MPKSDERDRDLSALAGPLLAELVDVECEGAFWRAVNQAMAFVPEAQRAEVIEALLAATSAWASEVTHRALSLATAVQVDHGRLLLDGVVATLVPPDDGEVH